MITGTLLDAAEKTSLRSICDEYFDTNNPLRKLSEKIASLEWSEAARDGFTSAQPPPYNLLANAEIKANWIPPTTSVPEELVTWKFQSNGFRGSTSKGLSLIFDPFIDSTLLIYAKHNDKPFKDTTVLVLTDYGPLLHFIGELIACQGTDWAETCVKQFLKAENLGATGLNIVKATCGKNSIDEIRKTEGLLERCFAEHRLLVWNYFPFFRGGIEAEGCAGLPYPIDKQDWLNACDNYLCAFLQAVEAKNLVWACNQDIQESRKSPNLAYKPKGRTERMKHPCRWNDGERRAFNEILKS